MALPVQSKRYFIYGRIMANQPANTPKRLSQLRYRKRVRKTKPAEKSQYSARFRADKPKKIPAKNALFGHTYMAISINIVLNGSVMPEASVKIPMGLKLVKMTAPQAAARFQ